MLTPPSRSLHRLDVAAEKVSTITHAVTDPITTRVDAVTTSVSAKVDETVTPYTNQIKDRLMNVAVTAKELSNHSQDYITNAEVCMKHGVEHMTRHCAGH